MTATTTRQTTTPRAATAPQPTIPQSARTPQPARAVIPGPQRSRPPRDPAAPDAVRDAGRDDGWTALVEAVREEGRYPTAAEAERVTRVVLSALGGQVTGDERVDLAHALPKEAAEEIASRIPLTRPQPAAEFVEEIAARTEGATPATARWDAGSVLGVLPRLTGEDLLDRVIAHLPPGYALLFGRAELTPATPRRRP